MELEDLVSERLGGGRLDGQIVSGGTGSGSVGGFGSGRGSGSGPGIGWGGRGVSFGIRHVCPRGLSDKRSRKALPEFFAPVRHGLLEQAAAELGEARRWVAEHAQHVFAVSAIEVEDVSAVIDGAADVLAEIGFAGAVQDKGRVPRPRRP